MAAYLHMPGEEILLIYDTIDPDSVSHSLPYLIHIIQDEKI